MQRTANENAACLRRIGAVGLFRSDMLLIFNMVWPWFSCGTVCVCPQFSYRDNDMIFWIFPIVPCHAFCMWHWPIGKNVDSSSVWGHHHLIVSIYGYQSTSWLLHIACYAVLTRPNKVETAVHGCNCWLSVGLYHVVVPLSFLRSISLASLFAILCFNVPVRE